MRLRYVAPSTVGDCTNVVSERFVSRAMRCIVTRPSASASWMTARPLPVSGVDVKTSTHVRRRPATSEVEILGRLLLEPEPVVLRCLLEEVRRLLEDVLVLLVGRDDVRRLRLAQGLLQLVGGELARRLV